MNSPSLWLLAHMSDWTDRIGNSLSTPWFRLSRWCYCQWLQQRGNK